MFEAIGGFFTKLFNDFGNQFYKTFIQDDNYRLFLTGLGNTLTIALFATIIGCIFGILIAIVRSYNMQTGKLKILNGVFSAFVAFIRGTPALVQLMIMYFIVFASFNFSGVGLVAAIFSFGLNSSAYVSEIVRSGIMSIDKGQTEAGRSLGLSTGATMKSIILPQAIKNILPALGNEFIVLLKETSVAGVIAIQELTKAGDIVRAQTYSPFFPLIAVALMYFVMVMGLSALLKRLERRLRKSDRS